MIRTKSRAPQISKQNGASPRPLYPIVTIYSRINERRKGELGQRTAGGPRDDLDKPWWRLGWVGARPAPRNAAAWRHGPLLAFRQHQQRPYLPYALISKKAHYAANSTTRNIQQRPWHLAAMCLGKFIRWNSAPNTNEKRPFSAFITTVTLVVKTILKQNSSNRKS